MRLINAQTFQFEDVWDEKNLQYAILSHRWEDDEVTFQDFSKLQGLDRDEIYKSEVQKKKGFQKIELSCLQAVHDQLPYVWVDTCCIDKSSSAELTEAINSMYRWYKHSTVCYAFLSDVSYHVANDDSEKSFSSSAWFARGWTLQELVAPRSVVFYDHQWEWLGTKKTLSAKISAITGIDEAILAGEDIFARSIAQRMSWASSRTTTRIEDMAYSLLGIFDVNMPLLYGEGQRAFLRLQEEIIRTSDDHTIFAWPQENNEEPGLLAKSPASFKTCKMVRAVGSRKGRSPYSMTNRGLSISLDAIAWTVDTYAVALQCVDELLYTDEVTPIEDYRLCMFVRRLKEDDQFVRVPYGGKTFQQALASIWEPTENEMKQRTGRPVRKLEMNIRQVHNADSREAFKDRVYGFRIDSPAILEKDKKGRDLFKVSAPHWSVEHAILSMTPGKWGTVGIVDISAQDRKIKVIKLGFDFDYNPVCFIAKSDGLSEKTHALDRQWNLNFNQDWQWTEKEHAEFKGIYQRNCFDTMAWSTVTATTASQLPNHSGLWAIKGDRVNGLSVKLYTHSIENDTILEMRRGEFEGKVIWNFRLNGLKDRTIRSLNPKIPSKQLSESGAVSDVSSSTSKQDGGFKLFKSK